MNNDHRFLLHPVAAAAAALGLTLACVADVRAQAAPSGSAAPSGGPSAPAGSSGTPTGSQTTPTGGYGSGGATGGTLGGPSDPTPYYIGVSQAFTHDSNVFRIPSGPADT